MFDILMDTTSACQLRCVMCPQSLPHSHQRPDIMDEATMQRVVEEVAPHANSLALSCMAEPTMNPQFGRLLELLEGHEIPSTSMVTNGMYLPDPIIERIVRAQILMASFSLDSPEAADYEAIRIWSRFSKVVASIRRLREKRDQMGSIRPAIKLNCVLMKRNIRSLPQLMELAAELGVAEIDLRHVLPFDGLDMHLQSLVFEPELAHEFLDKAEARAKEVGVSLRSAPRFNHRANGTASFDRLKQDMKMHAKRFVVKNLALPRCNQPWRQLVIHPNGEIYPCTNWIYDPSTGGAQVFFPPVKPVPTSAVTYCLGNLRRQSFRQIYDGATWKRLREELMGKRPMQDLCQHCTLRLSMGGQLYDPEEERVQQARKWGPNGQCATMHD